MDAVSKRNESIKSRARAMSSFHLRKDRLSSSKHNLTQKSSSPTEITKVIRRE
jgi:hypothetical protein